MARPKGSPNKQKTIGELEAELAKLRGESGDVATPAQASTNNNLKIVTETKTDSTDAQLECGYCHNSLDREYETCPYCGTRLTWE